MSPSKDMEKWRASRRLFIACAVSLVFMIGEVIGGYAAHSLAIMTDAAHLLTDFGSILISIFCLWLSARPHTYSMSFGWQRLEILGMFLSIVSPWTMSLVLVSSAVHRIIEGDYEINSRIMLVTSGCAVGVNILMALILHQPGSAHSHSHASPTPDADTHSHHHRHGNASVKAAFIRVVGDLLHSIGVLLAATIIHLWPQLKIADPVCTLVFLVLVLGTTFPVTKDVLRILMEGSPRHVSLDSVDQRLQTVVGVRSIHHLHALSINMSQTLLSAHVDSEENADVHTILTEATELLKAEFGFVSVTIQVENNSMDRLLHRVNQVSH